MRASQVVKDLLTFARRSEPRAWARLDLNELVERTLRLRTYELKSTRRARGVRARRGSAVRSSADARQIQQVLPQPAHERRRRP